MIPQMFWAKKKYRDPIIIICIAVLLRIIYYFIVSSENPGTHYLLLDDASSYIQIGRYFMGISNQVERILFIFGQGTGCLLH